MRWPKGQSLGSRFKCFMVLKKTFHSFQASLFKRRVLVNFAGATAHRGAYQGGYAMD